MTHKIEIKKMAKKILRTSNGLHNPELMHPSREWAIGLFVCLVVSVLATSWSVRTYLYYRDFTVDEDVAGQTDVVIYRETVVETALNHFSEREKIFSELSQNKITPEPINEAEEEIENTATSSTSEDFDEVEILEEVN